MAKSINEINREKAMDKLAAAGSLPERVRIERSIAAGTYCEFLGPGAGTVRTTCKGVHVGTFKCSNEKVNEQFCSCIISIPRKKATTIDLSDGTITQVEGDLTEYVAVCERCEHRVSTETIEPPKPQEPPKPAAKKPSVPGPALDPTETKMKVTQCILEHGPGSMTVSELNRLAESLMRLVRKLVAEPR